MIWLVLIFLGLVLGSFINALVWRLHEQDELSEKKQDNTTEKRRRDLSIVRGRSMCSHCGHLLGAKDLVPVLSWLWLRGKCRYCHKPIPDTPLPELILPALFILSYAFWPVELQGVAALAAFGIWLISVVVLLALVIYDAKWFLLPDKLVLALTVLALAFVGIGALAGDDALRVVRDALLGVLSIAGVFYVLYRISEDWIGFGDVKVGVPLGLLAGGFSEGLLLLFIASVLGSLYGLLVFALKRQAVRKLRVPFGPFLITAAFVVVLWGTDILQWYSDLLFGF